VGVTGRIASTANPSAHSQEVKWPDGHKSVSRWPESSQIGLARAPDARKTLLMNLRVLVIVTLTGLLLMVPGPAALAAGPAPTVQQDDICEFVPWWPGC